MRLGKYLRLAILFLFFPYFSHGQAIVLPAFPGAQGSGGMSFGGSGRNGSTPSVYVVDTTTDSGGGVHLRDCVQASGPRTCVFRVSGYIQLTADLVVANPYLTIAGQSSPGGIWIGGTGVSGTKYGIVVATHDVVIRYLGCTGDSTTFTPGDSTGTVCFKLGSTNDDVYNVILDHTTARWMGSGAFLSEGNHGSINHPVSRVTVQQSLFYEPAGNVLTPTTGFPACVKTTDIFSNAINNTNQDFHHNMFINCGFRTPLFNTASGRIVSNIVFDYGGKYTNYQLLGQGGVNLDIIDNWYEAFYNDIYTITRPFGDVFSEKAFMFNSSSPIGLAGSPSIFMTGNYSLLYNGLGTLEPPPVATVSDQRYQTSLGTESGQTDPALPIVAGPNGYANSGWFRGTALPDVDARVAISHDVMKAGGILTMNPTPGAQGSAYCPGDTGFVDGEDFNAKYVIDSVTSVSPNPCNTAPSGGIITWHLSDIGSGYDAGNNPAGLIPGGEVPGVGSSALISALTFSAKPTAFAAQVGNSQTITCAGTFSSNRNSQDQRVIDQFLNFLNSNPTATPGDYYHGQHTDPFLSGSLCTSSLGDGIADQWKTNNGLSTTDVNLWKTISPNGYTYLENYLNGVSVGPPTPTPFVCIVVSPYDFGDQLVGSSSGLQTFTVTSCGTANLVLASTFVTTSGTDASSFHVPSFTCSSGLVLAPSTSCTVSVFFHPTTVGGKAAMLDISGNASNEAALAGNGVGTPGVPTNSTPSIPMLVSRN